MLKNIKYVRSLATNPLIYDNKVRKYLSDTGSFYIYGFDNSFRPLAYFNPRKITEDFLNDFEFSRRVLNRVVSYVEERIFVRGRTESCILFIDVEDLGYFELKKIINKILKIFANQLHLITRIYRIYFLNVPLSFKMMKSFSLPFISDYLKDLVRVTSGYRMEEMEDHINPYQLQEKYGGLQKNLSKGEFW